MDLKFLAFFFFFPSEVQSCVEMTEGGGLMAWEECTSGVVAEGPATVRLPVLLPSHQMTLGGLRDFSLSMSPFYFLSFQCSLVPGGTMF